VHSYTRVVDAVKALAVLASAVLPLTSALIVSSSSRSIAAERAIPNTGTTAVRDCTLIDGTGAPPRPHSTIVFRGERIILLGPARSTRIPKGARIIDARGKYVIPGLWDMHVHLWGNENVLPKFLAYGVTGVRDMGSDFARVAEWRKAIESGKAIGPHVLTSGPAVAGERSNNPRFPVILAMTPNEARAAFDRIDRMDIDFVKITSSLPRDAYFALAEQCRHWRVPFAGQLPNDVRASEAIEARQASIEHLSGEFLACSTEEWKIRSGKAPPARVLDTFSAELARKLFRDSARFETRQTPMLTSWERTARLEPESLARNPALKSVPAAIRASWPRARDEMIRATASELAARRRQFALAKRMVALMRDSGVQILAGADTGDPFTAPGDALHRELELLVEAGLTPMEAIQSATLEAARFLGWDGALGALKVGMVADLVLLDSDPLANISNIRKVSGVVIRGAYLDRSRLDALLGVSRPRGAQTRRPKPIRQPRAVSR
jgi:hypothetical protein